MHVRYELIEKKREAGEIWEQTQQAYAGQEYPDSEVVFYNEADGKHYGYVHEGCREYDSNDVLECFEVVKKEVVKTTWVRR